MNAQASKVFQKHYKAYISQLAGLDLAETGRGAGGRIHTGPGKEIRVAIPYFNESYFVSAHGVENEAGNQPGYDICTILCRYLIMAQTWTKGPLPSGNPGWVNFRDLKDSGPLTVYFRDNTEAGYSPLHLPEKRIACLISWRPLTGRCRIWVCSMTWPLK